MEHAEAPTEVVLGRAAITLTAILDREMDAIFQDLVPDLDVATPRRRQRTVAANRIVLLCRSLADEVRRYEHLYWVYKHESLALDVDEEIEF
jgi:hypothetical protein